MPSTITAAFECIIEKAYQGEYFTNRYYLQGEDLASLVSPAFQIVTAERAITDNRIAFTKYSIRTTVDLDYNFITVPLNVFGTMDNGGSDLLPLFNVVKVDLQAVTGRPSRKYMRGVLAENAVTNMRLNQGLVDAVQTNYATVLAGLDALVDPQGTNLIAGTVDPAVRMRQLRRGSKKKNTQS